MNLVESIAKTKILFFYGTLRDHEVREAVIGDQAKQLNLVDAYLIGYKLYRVKNSNTLVEAQQNCQSEKSQVCDINQLIDICRNSANIDDAFYLAGEPVLISEKAKDYFVFPMLKDSNNDCFNPEITYDIYAEEPVPVKVNFLASSGVHDITSYKGEYF